MRKSIKLLALVAGIAATVVSCNKEKAAPETQEPLKLIIRAGAPETKTAITYDGEKTYTPSWSENDAIGVYFTDVSEDATEFVNADAGSTALFVPSSEITGVSGDQTLYSFYPLSALYAALSGTSIRVNIKDIQNPNAVGTFDKAADILVARPYAGNISTIKEDGGIIDLAFARLLSVVKVTPTDATTGEDLDGEYVKSVKIEYNGSGDDAPLTGRVDLDLDSGEFGSWTLKTYSATAAYGDNVFALNGTNAAYLLVNPTIIEAGKKVTFTVKTNKHDAYKEVSLAKALTFPAGNIAKINLNIDDDTWTIKDNTLDPNIVFKTPFYADINSNTTYNADTHGDLGVVGTSKPTITYTFAGSNQLRNNTNKISDDDASFYWCTNTTSLVIGGINTGTAQYFTLSFARKVPTSASNAAVMGISISENGSDYFPVTATKTISITKGEGAGYNSYNFSIPEGEHTNLRLKFENSGEGLAIDNVTLTKLAAAGENNKAVTFVVEKEDPELVVSPSPVNLTEGATQQLTVTGTDGTIHYTSNNAAVATVTSEGLVTAVAEGSTTISITSDASDTYNAGSTSVTINVTAAGGGSDPTWEETALADLEAGDVFVIVGNGQYAIANDVSTSSGPSPVSVTVSSDELTGTIANNIKWTLTGNATDGYTFYSNANALHHLYCSTSATSGSNDNIRVGPGSSPDRKAFVLDNDHIKTKDNGTARYIGINGTSDFRGYISSSTNSVTFKFYKYTVNDGKSDAGVSLSYSGGAITYGDNPVQLTLTKPDGLAVTCSSDDTGVADVTDAALITIKGAGSATITASWVEQTISSTTYRAGSVTYELTVDKKTPTIDAFSNPTTSVAKGGTVTNTTTISDGLTITYTSSNTKVATVTSAGVVTGVDDGTATISATFTGNANFNAATPQSYTITVGSGGSSPAVGTTMWAETWTGATTASSASNSATPSANYGNGTTVYNSGTVSYTQSANSVYVRNDTYAGGTAPELMLTSSQTWTISNIPTGGASELTLTYKSNNTKSSVTCPTDKASITGSSKSYTITTGGAQTITLVFSCSGNTRIDDVSLTVK